MVGAVTIALLAAAPVLLLGAPLGNRSGIDAFHGPLGAAETAREGPCPPSTSCSPSAPSGSPASSPAAPGLTNYTEDHLLAWSQVAYPPTGFGSGGGLVANSSSGVAIAFGGVDSGVLVNTTLTYSEPTDHWSTDPLPTAPSPRSDFAFGLDGVTGTAVLFGGLTNLTTLAVSNQTWSYDLAANRWTLSTHGAAPPAREAGAFAIDPALGVGVLYGGWNRNYSMTGSLTYSDLWELNLSTDDWTNLTVTGARPPALEGASMTWDPLTRSIEMFGGCYPCSSAVWQFRPPTKAWTELSTPSNAPAARGASSWCYAPTLGADLLFGGTNGVSTFNDTELFNATSDTWLPQTLPPGPAARSSAPSAFLDFPGNETWLLAGGLVGSNEFSDLWRLSETANVSLLVVNASDPTSPIAGALVNLSGRRAGATGPDGFLNLTQANVVGQAFNVTDDPFYYPLNGTLWLHPGRSASRTLELRPEPVGNVSIEIFSPEGYLPGVACNLTVDGVLINHAPAITNASGNATFYGVPPGLANVSAQATGWRSTYAIGILLPGGSIYLVATMDPDPTLTVLTLGTLPGGGTLLPLDGVRVYLNRQWIGSSSDVGTLVSVTSAIGLATVTATVFGFDPTTEYVDIPFTGPVNATLVLHSQPYGTLAVTVVRYPDDLPINAATVYANTSESLAFGFYQVVNTTDISGTASLLLPEGMYILTATAYGYFPSSESAVNVTSGPNSPVTILLLPIPPATLNMIVQDASTGRPISGANVTTIPGGTRGRTDGAGWYNQTDLVPGFYSFTVIAQGYYPNVTGRQLAMSTNVTMIVNLTAEPSAMVVGGGWTFSLFPGTLDELWPFLLIPALLVVGSVVFASVLRGWREEAEPLPRTRAADRPADEGSSPAEPVRSAGAPPRPGP